MGRQQEEGVNGVCIILHLFNQCIYIGMRKSVCTLNTNTASVTKVAYDNDGLTFAIGSSEGTVHLYDIRASKPLQTKVVIISTYELCEFMRLRTCARARATYYIMHVCDTCGVCVVCGVWCVCGVCGV